MSSKKNRKKLKRQHEIRRLSSIRNNRIILYNNPFIASNWVYDKFYGIDWGGVQLNTIDMKLTTYQP